MTSRLALAAIATILHCNFLLCLTAGHAFALIASRKLSRHVVLPSASDRGGTKIYVLNPPCFYTNI